MSSNKSQNKIRNIFLAILPGLVVFGLVFSANFYYDLDTTTVKLEEPKEISISSDATALTVNQTGAGTIADFKNATGSVFTIANNGDIATGTWKATPIGAAYGGTGTSTASWTGVPYITAGTWGTTTAPTISGGQANYLPLWSSATALGTSTIFQSGTSIGIGTTAPGYKLEVVGMGSFDYIRYKKDSWTSMADRKSVV